MRKLSIIAVALLLALGCQQQQTPEEQASQPEPQAQANQTPSPSMLDSDTRIAVGSDTVKAGQSGMLEVEYAGVEDAKALVVPLQFSATITADSCTWGPLAQPYGTKLVKLDDTLHTILLTVIPVQEPVIPAGEGILGWVHFTVSSDVAAGGFAVEDCFVPPASHLSYVDASNPPQLMRPQFDAGTIVIQ